MKKISSDNLTEAIQILLNGGVIAYPTEAVYGFGCDPFNEAAVGKILSIKHRSIEKGLILIAADSSQIQPLIGDITDEQLQKALDSWPGPYTWVFPSSPKVPDWIKGKHETIALRVTNHPIANKLCELFGGPIVSTSANVEGRAPLTDPLDIENHFQKDIDGLVIGPLGDLSQPTTIRDIVTGKVYR